MKLPSFKIDHKNPFLHFFAYPNENEIGELVYSDSTLYKDYVFDSIWAKLFKNRRFYNFFVAEKGVAIFTLFPNLSVSKEVIFYDDEDFVKKVSKYKNRFFCEKSMQMYNEKFLNKSFENQNNLSLDVMQLAFHMLGFISFFVLLVIVFYIDAKFFGDHIFIDMFVSLVIWEATYEFLKDKYIDKKPCL